MITVGIHDPQTLLREALVTTLAACADFRPLAVAGDAVQVIDTVKTQGVNVLIFNIHEVFAPEFALIKQLTQRFERLRILVISHTDNEQIIVRSIKAGAKGYLASAADLRELNEAIYTLRNGYDFYSRSIAHLLLGKYINGMLADKPQAAPGVEMLSQRQIEILRLWGSNKSNKEIAEELFLSVRTVESHKNHIMQKLNLKTTVDMLKFGIRNNLIDL